jgi:hypothetical protein
LNQGTPHYNNSLETQQTQFNSNVVKQILDATVSPGTRDQDIDMAAAKVWQNHMDKYGVRYTRGSMPTHIATAILQELGQLTPAAQNVITQTQPKVDEVWRQFKKGRKAEQKAEMMQDVMGVASVLSMAFPGAGQAIGNLVTSSATWAPVIGNAVIGGTLSAATGGDFIKGAATAGVGSFASSFMPDFLVKDLGIPKALAPTVSNTVIGGVKSLMNNGSFGTGVVGGLTSSAISEGLKLVGTQLTDLGLSPAQAKAAISVAMDLAKDGKLSTTGTINTIGNLLSSDAKPN